MKIQSTRWEWLNQSTDGGKTFKAIRDPHADHHGLWIDPQNSNYLLNVQDGGLSISYDRGANWKYPISELPLAQFYNAGYDFNHPVQCIRINPGSPQFMVGRSIQGP
ncbi:MAG: hypothetical protein R2744_13680 [Bacteroidales bacterium]